MPPSLFIVIFRPNYTLSEKCLHCLKYYNIFTTWITAMFSYSVWGIRKRKSCGVLDAQVLPAPVQLIATIALNVEQAPFCIEVSVWRMHNLFRSALAENLIWAPILEALVSLRSFELQQWCWGELQNLVAMLDRKKDFMTELSIKR